MSIVMSETPSSYDCEECIASGRQNVARGKECLLYRDLKENPIKYSYKVRNIPELRGLIRSKEELFSVLDRALQLYKTEDLRVALKRMGRGVCIKSLPVFQECYYFLDLYNKTHGGETGTELLHLPYSGGILEQPQIFFDACDHITRVKSAFLREKLDAEDKNRSQDNISGKSDLEGDAGRKKAYTAGRI